MFRFRGSGSDAYDLASPPDVGPVKRWIYGVVLAAVPVGVGIYCLIVGRAWLFGRGGVLVLHGAAAVAAAIAYIGAGALLHLHFFCAGQRKLWRAARIGKPIAALMLVGGLVWALLEVLIGLASRL